jgi:RND family efflux transporter MFP subunit
MNRDVSRVHAGKARRAIGPCALAIALTVSACEEPNTYVEPPPPQVTIARPLVREVVDALELTGTTRAAADVEVRARVPGVLESMHFEPGTVVQAGDLLFVIDRVVYETAAQAARANLTQAEAARELANVTLARMRDAGAAVSRAQVDEAAAAANAGEAEVELRRANLRQAEIDLGYTEVRAPITGRVGRNQVDVGNLVGEGEATALTEVTAFDPIYAYFTVNERDLLRVMAMWRERIEELGLDPEEDTADQARIAIYMGLADEEGYPHEGVLDFAESGVNPDTGTLQLRGSFPNPSATARLLPGLFARIRVPIAERADMPLVADRAIGADQSGSYVLVVDPQDAVVEKRNVRLGQLVDGLRVIEEGIGPDEWVVVNGLQRARPGAKVDHEMTEMAALTASALTQAAKAKRQGDGEPLAPEEVKVDDGTAPDAAATEPEE